MKASIALRVACVAKLSGRVLLGQFVGKLVEDALGQSTRGIVDVGAHFVSVHFQGCLNCLPVPVECGREQ